MKKKTIVIVCIILAVVLGAGGFTAYHFVAPKKRHEPDLRKAPVPITVDVEPVLLAESLEEAASLKAGLTEKDTKTAMLFGQSYPAKVLQSNETYKDSTGIMLPTMRWTEYFDANGAVLYTYIIRQEQQVVFDADGKIVFSSDGYTPDANYEAEPMRWFYKDGKVALGEMSVYSGEDSGCTYYSADGHLLGARTEYPTVDKDGSVQVELLYFDGSFVQIEKDAFDALIPPVDVPAFLQINWE